VDKAKIAAEAIARSRRSLTPLAPLGSDAEPLNLKEAYQIQDELHALLAPDLGRLAGYKIGCTSAVMQKYLSIAHPCAGGIFANRIYDSGASLKASNFIRAGVECEIAVRLGRDLKYAGVPFTKEDVADAVDAYFPAIEVVDDRYVKWETLGAPTLVADDFFGAAIVLGEPVLRTQAPDLGTVVGRAFINGAEIGSGKGADLMGHPNNPVAWLANHLATEGKELLKGQTIMTGSSVQTVWLRAAEKVEMQFSHLGSVSLEFL
jgi:2-keto-4-pentenoate hydratase